MSAGQENMVLKPLGEWAKEFGILLPKEQEIPGVFSAEGAENFLKGYLKYKEQKLNDK